MLQHAHQETRTYRPEATRKFQKGTREAWPGSAGIQIEGGSETRLPPDQPEDASLVHFVAAGFVATCRAHFQTGVRLSLATLYS